MTAITFSSTQRDDSTCRISDCVVSHWTSADAATVGDLQAIADAYLRGYDSDGEEVEFKIFDLETNETLAQCYGYADGTATCEFAD